jgi:hypothetical protein
MGLREKISLCLSLLVLFGAFCRVQAQSGAPKFEVDPTQAKSLSPKAVFLTQKRVDNARRSR